MRDYSLKERAVARETALSQAAQWADRESICVDFEDIGQTQKTVFCKMYRKGVMVSNGCGKGVGLQAGASSFFEAIEHYFSIFSSHIQIDDYFHLDLDSADYLLDEGSPPFRKILGNFMPPFTRTMFTELLTTENRLLFPTFLLNPDYTPRTADEQQALSDYSLKRYSTNSGIAAGYTIEEALLHGLLETLERDALGIAILKSTISNDPSPLRKVRSCSLSSELQDLIEVVQEETKGIVTVWDITCDTRIPCSLVKIEVGNSPLVSSYFGSGASLVASYAIERGLLEALQHFHLVQKSGRKPILLDMNHIQRLPKYLRCCISKGIFYYPGGDIDVDYLYLDSDELDLPPLDQISRIVDYLRQIDMKAFARTISREGPFVTQIVVPRAERFHLVARGVPVLPGRRGERYLC